MSLRLRDGGPIAWMARHSVAPNLLMLVLILGGLAMTSQIRQEVFPRFELDRVSVTIALPGATPEEVEQSIIQAIEEEIRVVAGVAQVTSTAQEGAASIDAELSGEVDRRIVLGNIEQAVDRITTLPDDAEEPEVSLSQRRREVVELQVYGDVTLRAIRAATEHVREALLRDPDISQVDMEDAEELELHVEVSQGALRAHGLLLSDVARIIRETALDRAGGTLETAGGDILVRMADRRDAVLDFERIPLITDARGAVVRLGDIATLRAGFEDADAVTTFNGLPAVRLNVYRVGEETPISTAEATRRILPSALESLPEGIDAVIVRDRSEYYEGRMQLLLKNGFIGLLLVLILLSLFLKFRTAFWVAVGIPTAFLGTLLFLPGVGASLNLVSMFAFIVALGIVVDDAIVVGENIHEYLERGMSRIDAAVQGARDIAVPLSFSILTNVVAFLPLMTMPGRLGHFFVWIPVVVSTAFLLSWIEALFILPAHLAGTKEPENGKPPGRLRRVQMAIAGSLDLFVRVVYAPLLRVAMAWRYTTVALMMALLALSIAWTMSGRMGWGLFPPIPRDYSTAVATLPVGAPMSASLAVRDQLVDAAQKVIDANGGDTLGIGVYAEATQNRVSLRVYLQPPEVRPISTAEFTRQWRETAGQPPAARFVRYQSSFGGPGGGTGIEIQLSHTDVDVLAAAASNLVAELEEFPQIKDAEDGFQPGKAQLEFRLTEEGRSLGLTADSIGTQLRAAFQGITAFSQQDGRNEVTVRVRLPATERSSEAHVENLLIRTEEGGYVPLYQVAEVQKGRAENKIERVDGRRVITVSANVAPQEETNIVLAAVTGQIIPQLVADYPGLGFELEGRQAQQRDIAASFRFWVAVALMIIFGLLAIPFRSYVQPIIVMMAIPFGFVGAMLGHMIMGMSLSIVSLMGMIALGGVVINAALVMIDYANKACAAGADPAEAIERAGQRRFRPIVLTTMTTFGGLAPMIFETSRQAQFLIPMAVSLGYGIVFSTIIVLFLIPCLYLILEDVRWLANPPEPERPQRVDEAATPVRQVAAE